ncbi:securin isoform X2 [Dermochelys coriacea]|uniref:securin isoform X2 n=1 Tax=Dermochelys coriacea TaxID=27794 RepID=UPI001CA93136|nr:securin isoform X2 [Dermochelys coriacea]
MATLIFIDKENEGDVGAAPKDRLRLSSVSSKVLSERSQIQTPLVGRTANATPARSQSVRKALGNVNRTLGTTNKKEIRKQKKQALPSKETTGKTTQVESCSVAAEEAYPEIENFFPFNPLELLQSTANFLSTLDEIIDLPPLSDDS